MASPLRRRIPIVNTNFVVDADADVDEGLTSIHSCQTLEKILRLLSIMPRVILTVGLFTLFYQIPNLSHFFHSHTYLTRFLIASRNIRTNVTKTLLPTEIKS